MRNGHGRMIWPNGGHYVGCWMNGMRHGEGILTWANGNIYVGVWKNNSQNGEAKFYYSKSKKWMYETWTNGRRVK